MIQEAENQITTDYAVCDQRPADSTLLVKSIELQRQKLGLPDEGPRYRSVLTWRRRVGGAS